MIFNDCPLGKNWMLTTISLCIPPLDPWGREGNERLRHKLIESLKEGATRRRTEGRRLRPALWRVPRQAKAPRNPTHKSHGLQLLGVFPPCLNFCSFKGGEMLMNALDLVEAEIQEQEEHDAKAGKSSRRPNPLLLGLSPHK